MFSVSSGCVTGSERLNLSGSELTNLHNIITIRLKICSHPEFFTLVWCCGIHMGCYYETTLKTGAFSTKPRN